MYLVIVLLSALLLTSDSASGQSVPCAVTTPNQKSAPEQRSNDAYGSNALSVSLPWPDGTVVFRPGGPGFVLSDGALSMKFGWDRRVQGSLVIDGRRLDGPAPPLRSNIPSGYGDIGFQSTALIFPTTGCWAVTGRVGMESLTFIARVTKIGDGPGAH